MLRPPKECACLMIRPPLKKLEKSYLTPAFFVILIIINYLILSFVILPCKFSQLTLKVFDEYCGLWFYINTCFFGVTLVLFITLNIKDPGYLKKPKALEFLVSPDKC